MFKHLEQPLTEATTNVQSRQILQINTHVTTDVMCSNLDQGEVYTIMW